LVDPPVAAFSDTTQRLYFTGRSLSAGGAPTVAFGPDWDDTANAGRAMLSATPLNTVNGSHNPTHAATVHNRLHRQFMFQLGGAGTLQGYVRAFLRAQTRNGIGIDESKQDMISQLVIRVVSANGAIVRGTALSAYEPNSSAGQTKWDPFAMRNRKFPSIGRWDDPVRGAMLQPIPYQAGDWLVVEVGLRNFTVGAVTGGHSYYNDAAASDLPEDEVSTANLRSWIEFSPSPPTELPPPGTEHNPPYTNQQQTGDPVSSYTGSLSLEHADVVIPGRGPTIAFARSYNSNDTRVTPLGPGWTHSYNVRLVSPGGGTNDLVLVGPSGRSDRYTWAAGVFTPPPGVHRTLVQNADYTYTATDKDQVTWRFDATGRLTQTADRHGNASNLVYDGSGQLTSVSDPAGRGSLTLGYTSGRLTSVTDWAVPARVVTYQYDGDGRLGKVVDREGRTTTFGYEGTTHRLTTITDARGNISLTNTYDAQGRVATQKDARGLATGDVITFDYVVNPDQTRVTTTTAPGTSLEPSFHPTLIDSYDANGWLTQRQTRPSSTETLTQTFTYDGEGNRASVTDARGNRTDFCYDVDYAGLPLADADNLTRRIDPPPTPGANRPVTLFSYDAKHNLVQTVAPKGVPSGPTVDCATNLAAVQAAYAVDFAYDPGQTRLLSLTRRFTDPDLGLQTAITKYEYNDAANPGLVTRLIPPRGNTGPLPDYAYATSMTYFTSGTRAGMLQDVTDPLGNKASYDYDPVGRLTSVVDPLGNAAGGVPAEHTTFYNWDKEDRLRFRTLPAPVPAGGGLVTETRYDEIGNPIVRIDANGQVMTYTYDSRNSLFQVAESPLVWTDPAIPPATVFVTEYAYDAGGNVTRVTRAKGDSAIERVVDYVYDGRGLARIETQYPNWPSTSGSLQTSYTYDSNGNLATLLDPLGRTTTSGHDALDRLTSVNYSDPGTPDVTYGYDANGNRTAMTDGTGATAYTYDESDQLTTVTSPGPRVVGYRYDLNGNRTKLIYPDATAVTYVFNTVDQLGSLTDWASRSVAYTYWPDSLVKTATNPNGSVATYGYDNARRLVDIAHTTPSAASIDRFLYTLDAVGNVTSVSDGGSLAAQFARPDGFGSSNGSWTGTYASIDEVTPNDADFLASPSGPTSSHFYEVTLSDVTEPYTRTGITVRYRYAKSGNNSGQTINLTVELRQGSTVIASMTHNNIPGVSGSGWQQGSFVLTPTQGSAITNFADLRIRFQPTASGGGQQRKAHVSWAEVQFASIGDPASQFTYGYDRLYRLTGVTGADGPRSYVYDPVGNRLTKVAGGSTTYTYDRADRITTAGGTPTTVDANGNLTAVGSDTFGYDQANRMTAATVAGSSETYTYDGDGTRFSRQVGANPAIRYVTDVGTPLPARIDDGTRKYVWGLGLAYAVQGSTIEVYHADRLGSVRNLSDGTSAIAATYRADEWGVPVVSTGSSTQPFAFTGEPRDATGLTYLRTRLYDASLGRFMSRDTWTGSLSRAQTLNRCAYATNNPVTYSDPTGHCVIDTFADAAFIGYDLLSLAFGPEKDREMNLLALGADVGAALLPCATGLGLAVRGTIKWVSQVGPDLANLSSKITRQMASRGWTTDMIMEAFERGHQFIATNLRTGGEATRYVHPVTGQSVVIDNLTGEIIHVGGPGFRY
jgi:RHS repeat-associated protein